MADLVVRGTRVVLPSGEQAADVVVEGERIAAVRPYGTVTGAGLLDARDLVVMPGLVDSHVHVNEPGRTEWEGFESATRAAAAGGTTTIVDMPLNSIPPTTSVGALEDKRRAARGRVWVDVAFWGGIVPGAQGGIGPMVAEGVVGFKAFLVESGVDEFPAVSPANLARLAPRLAPLGVPLVLHAELLEHMAVEQAAFAALPLEGRRSALAYAASRPALAEDEAVRLAAGLARGSGATVHVLHLASGTALPHIDEARGAGVPLTAETCPHYLLFAAEEIPSGATEFKCAPPIRGADHREALWEGLRRGSIGMVVSDHAPAPPGLKALDTGDFAAAWGGISSLQLRLPAVWSEARRRGFSPEDLAEWLARAPARLAGLPAKGAIEPGNDADLVVWDPDREVEVVPRGLEHRHPVSPYAGRMLAGAVEVTILRGRVVFEGSPVGPPAGRLLVRGR